MLEDKFGNRVTLESPVVGEIVVLNERLFLTPSATESGERWLCTIDPFIASHEPEEAWGMLEEAPT